MTITRGQGVSQGIFHVCWGLRSTALEMNSLNHDFHSKTIWCIPQTQTVMNPWSCCPGTVALRLLGFYVRRIYEYLSMLYPTWHTWGKCWRKGWDLHQSSLTQIVQSSIQVKCLWEILFELHRYQYLPTAYNRG